ncbi:hypothetical protein CC2G_013732 [Coprinopsis cinerea AmutBmut pab1-1]|nr:hypothetical protein CC2G_013732 [Coprinopsis cinerea AmutBmut pab1-1]
MDMRPVFNGLILDNDDPLLRYKGEWETNLEEVDAINQSNRAGPLFNHTSRWTTGNGSVSATFHGMSIISAIPHSYSARRTRSNTGNNQPDQLTMFNLSNMDLYIERQAGALSFPLLRPPQ